LFTSFESKGDYNLFLMSTAVLYKLRRNSLIAVYVKYIL